MVLSNINNIVYESKDVNSKHYQIYYKPAMKGAQSRIEMEFRMVKFGFKAKIEIGYTKPGMNKEDRIRFSPMALAMPWALVIKRDDK